MRTCTQARNSAASSRYTAPTIASVTTRYSAACTTFWLVTRRKAARLPIPASTTNAISWALTCGSLPSGLLPSCPNGGRLGAPIGHSPVGALGYLFLEDSVVRLLVRLHLVPLRRRSQRVRGGLDCRTRRGCDCAC